MAETKHKKFSRKKKIYAKNISDPLTNEVIEATSIKELAKLIEVSAYRIRRIVNGDFEADYLRSQKTGKLWRIEYNFDYAVKAIPMYQDAELLDEVHFFTSAYKCCVFLGISKDTYYKRKKLQPTGEPCKKLVKDVFDREWQLIFLTNTKDSDDWRFHQDEDF